MVTPLGALRAPQAVVDVRFRGGRSSSERDDGHDPPVEAAFSEGWLALSFPLLGVVRGRVDHGLVGFVVLAAPSNCFSLFRAGISDFYS